MNRHSAHPVPGGGPDELGKGRSSLKKWLFASLAVFFVAIIFVLWVLSYGGASPSRKTDAVVYIPSGSGFSAIQQLLADHDVIVADIRFEILARILGASGRLQAGEYVFSPGLSHKEVIAKLTEGEILYRSLSIPEGSNLYQIADVLAHDFDFDRREFLRLVNDREFIDSFGLSVASLEGYLFPDTYFVSRQQSLDDVLAMMVRRFQQVFSDIAANQALSFPGAGSLSYHQVIILASIVEKETGIADERPLVAAVFLNRLKKNMKLQADPTVIYGIADFNGNLTRKDLKTPSPYNTYTLKGLPAGPIANPGRPAIEAVLRPADVGYLYFVAKKDGRHYFSTTFQEHNRAVRRFQRSK